MCGITASIALPQGKLNGHTDGTTPKTLTTQLQGSIDVLNHRGPDESGIWISSDNSIGLGHCRLSINDLSPSGSQPLTSDDGQIHAIVNGEIYDYERLRSVCVAEHGYTFIGESDSELVVAMYKIYRAPDFFQHLRGEFAFVIYDDREGSKKVIAGRDRFGIKPLVYSIVEGRLLIASESKAFLPLGWKPEWDVGAIVDAGWMIDDRTLFKGVKKLLPGHWMEVTEERGIETRKYWDAEYEDKTKVETRTIDEMILGVRERLVESIRLRLRADVPVGIYLSGGIDSSAVAGIVTHLARQDHVKIGSEAATRVACFSVRFPAASGYDESEIAERTAEFLGVEVIKKDVDEASLARDFADTAYHCEHHHFNLNSVAKFALSTLPRDNGIKVVLTGEGSDEHFAGYLYFPIEFLREPDLSQPESLLASDNVLREDLRGDIVAEMKKIMSSIGAPKRGEEGWLDQNPNLTYANGNTIPETSLVSHPTTDLFAPWVREQYRDLDCRETFVPSFSPEVRAQMRSRWHPLHTAQYMWNKSSLPNVLLSCLGDRTEMAHSVEARTPFLDHHLTEYVNRLPPSVKVVYTPGTNTADQVNQSPIWRNSIPALQSMREKWILREAVRPFITKEQYERKKHPFLAPTRWPQNGALHHMFEKLLTREAIQGLGFLDYAVVEDALGRAFGDKAESRAFHTLAYVGAWVTLSERFGVQKASKQDFVR